MVVRGAGIGDLRRSNSCGEGSGVSWEAAKQGGRWSPSWGRSLCKGLGLQEGGAPRPPGFLGLGGWWDREAHPSRGGGARLEERGPGSPAAASWGPAAACGSAAPVPGGRCILRVSTRGCGGRKGSVPHTLPP